MSFHKPDTHSLLESQHLIGRSLTKIYLIYENKQDFWWQRLLKNNYKHVHAVKFNGLFWIKMNFGSGFTDFDVLPYDWRDTITNVLEGQDVTYQYIEVWRKRRYRVRSLFAPYTCVEAMKSLLGIRAWWMITPYQLFKYCEAHNEQRRRRNTSTKKSNSTTRGRA